MLKYPCEFRNNVLRFMKKKIMIIEDNKILSDMYKFKFSLEWFDVFVENESENAIREFKKFAPDLIILDVMMPGMNGFELLEIIRKEEKSDVKIVVLSNLNDQKDKEKALSLWADKFLLKASLSPKELIEEIKTITV